MLTVDKELGDAGGGHRLGDDDGVSPEQAGVGEDQHDQNKERSPDRSLLADAPRRHRLWSGGAGRL